MPVRCRSTRLMAWGTWRRSGSSLVSRSSVDCSWCRIMTLSLYSLLVFQTSLKIFEPFWADGFNFFPIYFEPLHIGLHGSISIHFLVGLKLPIEFNGFFLDHHLARHCPWWRTMRWSWLMGDRCCRPSNWMGSWLLGRHGSGQTNRALGSEALQKICEKHEKLVEILCNISEIIQIDIVMTRHDNENTGKPSTTSWTSGPNRGMEARHFT